MRKILFVAFLLVVVAISAEAQLLTMSNNCFASMKKAVALNDEKKYDSALALYKSLTKCNSKDAKEQKAYGMARSLNGLKQYDEAITWANAALKETKNKSINGYFERAMAYSKKGMPDSSRTDFERIIALTEKNQNVKERATIYAMIADQYWKADLKDSARSNLEKAMALDAGNSNFCIQKGDWGVREGNYDQAFENYDKAVALGRTDLEMYKIRSGARMKMVQDKYGTDNAQELRKKMTATEKDQVCTELKKLLSLGYKNMQAEMFEALVCN